MSIRATITCGGLLWLVSVAATLSQTPASNGAARAGGEIQIPAAPLTNGAVASSGVAQADANPFVELKSEDRYPTNLPAGTPVVSTNRISLTFDQVLLLDVVRMFTKIADVNIVFDPSNLQGAVSVNLQDVEWKPALTAILEKHGLSLTEKPPGSGVYDISPKVAGAAEPLLVETIALKYASVSNVVSVVFPLLEKGGTVAPYPSLNSFVVRSTAGNIREIKQIIESIDKPRQQVYIEARFLDLDDSASTKLGLNWARLKDYGVTASSLSDKMTETTRRTLMDSEGALGGQSRTWNRTRGLTDNTPLDDTDLGAESYNQQLYEQRTAGKNITGMAIDPTAGLTMTTIIPYEFERVRTAILSADDFRLILSALKETGGWTIISNPRIVVANEVTATIHIGERQRPFVSSVTPGQQGIAPVVTYNPGEAVDLGVMVQVTPTINTQDRITVRIEPELTDVTGVDTAPNGQTYPIVRTKTIKTTFTLENGKTAAIGGLTQGLERNAVKKLPMLGDIPVIGKFLFTHTFKEREQRETIIFVTVGLADPGVLAPDIGLPSDAELIRREMKKSKTALPNAESLAPFQDPLSGKP